MDTNILAVLIQEGSKILSQSLRNRTPQSQPTTIDSVEKYVQDSELRLLPYAAPTQPAPAGAIQINVNQEQPYVPKATAIATGCIPCAMGHFGTCSGILSESIRFSRTPEGLASPEVIDRVNMCMDELNAMERVDLRPEMTYQLTGWEKDLANKALSESRSLRHKLEGLKSIEELEEASAMTQTTRKAIGREWFQKKLSTMPEADKEEIKRRVMAKIEEMAATEET
jgi:hypothetical protein